MRLGTLVICMFTLDYSPSHLRSTRAGAATGPPRPPAEPTAVRRRRLALACAAAAHWGRGAAGSSRPGARGLHSCRQTSLPRTGTHRRSRTIRAHTHILHSTLHPPWLRTVGTPFHAPAHVVLPRRAPQPLASSPPAPLSAKGGHYLAPRERWHHSAPSRREHMPPTAAPLPRRGGVLACKRTTPQARTCPRRSARAWTYNSSKAEA